MVPSATRSRSISAELHIAIVSRGDQDVAMQSGEERFTVDDLYELSNLARDCLELGCGA